jgi:hypothetical protein
MPELDLQCYAHGATDQSKKYVDLPSPTKEITETENKALTFE